MRKEYLLNLDSLNDLKNFVEQISMLESDVDGIYERQLVDAKSFLGLVTISHHSVKVRIHSNDEREIRLFKAICEKYEVRTK